MKNPKTRTEAGFTLIELLVVMAVMGILSGMLAYAMAQSQQQARNRRCTAELLNYGQILQTRLAGIAYAEIGLNESIGTVASTAGGLGLVPAPAPADMPTVQEIESSDRARLALMARRDFARMVLPECQADLLVPPVSLQFRVVPPSIVGLDMLPACAKIPPPPLWDRMRTLAGLRNSVEVDRAAATFGVSGAMSNPRVDAVQLFQNNAQFRQACSSDVAGNPVNWTREYESAECLYLILATFQSLGQLVVDQIPARNIGDLDGDGVPEILDPWGTPVRFMRSPIGLSGHGLKNWVEAKAGAGNEEEFPFDVEPLDFLLTDWRHEQRLLDTSNGPVSAFAPIYLPPIVISAGDDRVFGIRMPEDYPSYFSTSVVELSFPPTPRYPLSSNSLMTYRYPDPFFDVSSGSNVLVSNGQNAFKGIIDAKTGGGLGGTGSRDTAADNITSIDGDL